MELCRSLGVRLWLGSGELRYRAVEGVMTPELMTSIGEHKAAIIELLSADDQPTDPEPNPPTGPPALPWRRILETWPDPLREQWGRLANDLAEAGYTWPSDEAEAFRRIVAKAKDSPSPPDPFKTTATNGSPFRGRATGSSPSRPTGDLSGWD